MTYKEFVRDRYGRGEQVPLWKAYVDYDVLRNNYIVAPIGFNVIFAIALSLFFWTRSFGRRSVDFYRRQMNSGDAS